MENNKNPLDKLFEQMGNPLPFAILKSKDEGFDYKCLASTIETYVNGRSYSIYQIPQILRIVGKKLDLFTQSLQAKLTESENIIPIVLIWEEREREILLLEVNEKEIMTEEFAFILDSLKEELREWIHIQAKLHFSESRP